MYLYRAVDSRANTLKFLLSPTRKCSSNQTLLLESACCDSYQHSSRHHRDKNAAYPKAFKELKAEGILPSPCELRQSKYLNKLVDAATIASLNDSSS